MKFYTFGDASKPVFMTLPGTMCYWSAIFGDYTEKLTEKFYVVMVSYDGFDETEDSVYPDMVTETERIEDYVKENLSGRIFCAYGCSLGGSYAAFLLQRRNIHIDHVIIGSSDMDEAEPFSAALQAKLIAGVGYGILQNGSLPGWMQKINEKKLQKHPESRAYRERFISLFTAHDMSFVKKESIYNQFYYDLVTKINKNISVAGSEVHVFYAKKMGAKYLDRYKAHFAEPDIREHNMEHEELFACHPEEWLKEVYACCGI